MNAGSAARWVTGPTSAEKRATDKGNQTGSCADDRADHRNTHEEEEEEDRHTAVAVATEAEEMTDAEATRVEADHLTVKIEETWERARSSYAKEDASFARSEVTSRETAPSCGPEVEETTEDADTTMTGGLDTTEVVASKMTVEIEVTPFAAMRDATLVAGRHLVARLIVEIIHRPDHLDVATVTSRVRTQITDVMLVSLTTVLCTAEQHCSVDSFGSNMAGKQDARGPLKTQQNKVNTHSHKSPPQINNKIISFSP